MGRRERARAEQQAARKAFGGEAAFWAMHCYDVIKLRGFWGRMKWLFLGR